MSGRTCSVVKENLEKLELLNHLWERFKAIPEMIRLAHGIVMAEFDLENEYESPFDVEYEIKNLADKVEKDLTKFVVRLVVGGLNVSVNVDEVYGRFKGKFNAVEIAKYVETEYLSRADDLAFKHTLEKARELLPYSVRNSYSYEEDPDAKLKLAKIQKKNKLVLQYHLDWGFGAPVMYGFLEAAPALEKLARIVLKGEKPSTVRALDITHAYWNNTTAEEVLQKKELAGPIQAVKVHKNGNVYFWFESEENARKVAEVLIYGTL